MAEIDRSLKAHELIKVRLYGIDREARPALITEICQTLACAEVQHIGNLLVLWREKPADNTSEKKSARVTRRVGTKKQEAERLEALNKRKKHS